MREIGDWHEYLIERLTNPEDAINRITTNKRAFEGCLFLKRSLVRSRAIHCASPKSY